MGGLFSRPSNENPSLAHIEARRRAEEAQKAAEQQARDAQALLQQIKQQAEQNSQRAIERQEEADRKAAQFAQEMSQMKTQMGDAAQALKRAEDLAAAASKASKEDAEKYQRLAQEERERSEKLRVEAEKQMNAIREEAEKAQRIANEQRREAEAGKALAEEAARTAAEEVRKAEEARKEAEKRLKDGIQPVVTPTAEEVAAAKRRIQYREDCFHFAVAGISGGGKSSLVNAFRGLRSRDTDAAAVGVTETTLEMARYADANPENPFVWYDIPGAGTLKCRDWQYFNDQGLYVFDCIIVLFDNRFTMTDIAILLNARRFNIPTYIVRSKADQHIQNIMEDMGYDSDMDEDVEGRERLYRVARRQFIDKTRRNVQSNLEDANIADQRVYIVSKTTLLGVVAKRAARKAIDEVELLNDLFNEAYRRRRDLNFEQNTVAAAFRT